MASFLSSVGVKSSILITGGGSGIGFAFAKRFVELGHEVIIVGRRQEQLDLAKATVPSLITIRGDVSTEDERINLSNIIKSNYPQVNVLINNAGIQNRLVPLSDPAQQELSSWLRHKTEIAINFEAPIHLTILLLPVLQAHPIALVANVTSGLSFVPIASMPTYCATKAALHSFTLSLRHQLQQLTPPIRVVEIVPPAVNTDLGGVGLHTAGENLDEYADHVIAKLVESDENVEIGYKMSERARQASRAEIDNFFKFLNSAH
jgi:uncharacterized oxidoreductase